MKRKIAILGSTGSIGKTLLKILQNDKKNFEIVLISGNKNYKELLKQSKIFKVKNLILSDDKSYQKLKKKNLKSINIYNNFNSLENILKNKIDYVMSAITGIDGLEPTLKIIKHTKKIAIANKESIICGWHLIKKEINKFNVSFIPVDSEHFSIFYALRGINISKIEKIYLTASGGPFKTLSKSKLKSVKISDAINHPNWVMGKKISVDSATMMNKVFEIIEAKKIFNLKYKLLDILVHPSSYIHAIIKFNDGMIKIIAHDTNMKIPIFNSVYENHNKIIKTHKLDLKKLNFLDFEKVNLDKFPSIDIIKTFKDSETLIETVIVLANDELVKLFLLKKIRFTDILFYLQKLIRMKKIKKLYLKKPGNLKSILFLDNYVRKEINNLIF